MVASRLWHWEPRIRQWASRPRPGVRSVVYAVDGRGATACSSIRSRSDRARGAAPSGVGRRSWLTRAVHDRTRASGQSGSGAPVTRCRCTSSGTYLMDTYGITAEQAATAVPTSWDCCASQKARHTPYICLASGCRSRRRLPASRRTTLLWLESKRAVISAHARDFGQGLESNERGFAPA